MTVLILMVAVGLIPFSVRALAEESLFDLESRWRASGDKLKDATREERLARAAEFFETVAWSDITRYCVESASAGPDLAQFLAGLVDGKLRQGDATTSQLLSIIANPDMGEACLGSIVKHIFANRDAIRSSADARYFAMAFLDLADSGTLPPFRARQLERGAANLWSGGGIQSRALRYARSEDESLVGHGVGMLCEDPSPGPRDSLVAVARELASGRRFPRALGRALNGLSACCGSDHFDLFLEMLRASGDDVRLRRDAQQAIARSQDPRAYAILIAEYDDGETGITDATSEIEDPDLRSFYWNLWYATRLAEPGIISLLGRNGPESTQAVHLLDRASRFGIPDTRNVILDSMENWAAQKGGGWVLKVEEITSRFRAFPDARGGAESGGVQQ